ncbi:LysM peptidoglycan-binding domain-containing protein [Seohaeicola zhoushanensis]|uniref:LysM domain-containing protein n=1 Tax=Seohaeicola zhoushanensis TaxID=1569283 RepID=A0A8J3GW96_9RHOB|nr:LysM peptidoglycan-binding domain-containing protein [Seohaeicola zhoushanensis]GHF44864.1 hypothetical protein GCM10017056_15560 [Seohaeicola zhoushanensis]
MAGQNGGIGTTGLAALAVGALALIGGGVWYAGLLPSLGPQPVAEVPKPAESAPVAEAKPEAAPVAEAKVKAEVTPAFDVVRVEPDGNAVIAGTAAPGARVVFLLDDREIGEAMADGQGKFVGLLTIDMGAGPHLLTMMAELDGQKVASQEPIILAPVVEAPATQMADAGAAVAEPEAKAEPAEAAATPEPVAAATEAAPVVVVEAKPEAVTPAPETSAEAKPEPAVVAQAVEAKPEAAVTEAKPEAPAVAAAQVAEAKPEASASVAEASAATPATEAKPEAAAQSAEVKPEAVAQTAEAKPETTAPTAEAKPEAVAQTAETKPEPTAPAAEAKPEPKPVQVAEARPNVPVPAHADQANAPPAPAGGAVASGLGTSAPAPVQPPVATSIAVLKATKDGVELIQPATPERPDAMEQIALDTISYSETGEVQLAGRAGGQTTVRVYLDNKAVADIGADETGKWKGELSGVKPGIYTLRLDALNAGGEVVSRLETPFKREAPEVLNPPSQENAPDQTPAIRAVTVQKGDTLWAISRERYGNGVLYVRVFEANRDSIRNPDLIYPGQVFSIP